MLQTKSSSSNKRIIIICERLNHLFKNNNDFWKEVLSYNNDFYLSNINGLMLHEFFHSSNLEVEVLTYKNYFTRANGYTKPKFKNKMWLNTAKFGRSDSSIASTIAHETIHNLDTTILEYNFGHGDNYDTPEKENCAPQWFASLAYKYLSEGIVSEKSSHGKEFIA